MKLRWCILFFFLSGPLLAFQGQPIRDLPPIFRITLPEEDLQPIEIAELDVQVQVVGNLATTTYEVLLYNPNQRVLEGSFEIPLADGQTMARFALDVNGKLREGVAVEKTKARETFEAIVRRNVDPGLLEQTQGNNFRIRVYPIPAGGHKRLVYAVQESLPWESAAMRYQLPLHLGQKVGKFSLRVDVVDQPMQPQWEENSFSNFAFEQWNTHFVAEHEAQDFEANQTLRFRIPKPAGWQQAYLTPTGDGDYYFMVQAVPEIPNQTKALPKRITMFWDASGSSLNRDFETEFGFIQAYFSQNRDVTVELVVFRDVAENSHMVEIKDGDSSPLVRILRQIEYDGGTSAQFFDQRRWTGDEIWLFSDALVNLSHLPMVLSQPVYPITSQPSVDFEALHRLAQQSGGSLVNLTKQSLQEGIKTLTTGQFQFQGAGISGATFHDKFPEGRQVLAAGEVFTLTGRISAPTGRISLKFGVGGDGKEKSEVELTEAMVQENLPLARRWAYQKYQSLAMDEERNRGSMIELAKAHTLVTSLTSLLVLETVEDYLEYKIMPPAELRSEYLARLEQVKKEDENFRFENIRNAVSLYQDRITWWQTDFPGWPKGERYTETDVEQMEDIQGYEVAMGMAREEAMEQRAEPSPTYAEAPEAAYYEESSSMDSGFGDVADMAMMSPVSPTGMQDEAANLATVKMEVQAWNPDRPYVEALRKVAEGKRYARYLELREEEEYTTSPGFYFDVANYFKSEGEEMLAMRILSNLAELELNSDELLRSLANQYRSWKATELAEFVYRKVLELRPEQPQSYRDLAMTLWLLGQYEEAEEMYMTVIADLEEDRLSRFPRIRELCLYELNAMREVSRGTVSMEEIPEAGQKHMPVDVRVVMTWNVSDVDIDLWMTDPFGEPCGYSNEKTRIGSRYTSDYTGGGLGPEEISLHHAKEGEYTIQAHYYGSSAQRLLGPVTVRVAIYTHYGTPAQEMQELTLQLENEEDRYLVGSFTFEK